MARLVSRQKYIPNGFKFYDAALRWTAPNNASFQVICDGLRSARLANPGVTRAKGLNTDANAIAEEVDAYNAAICEQMGWTEYITGASGGSSVPFQQDQYRPSLSRNLANVAAGSRVLVEWIASGAEAVPQEQANRRAEICSKCPLNGKGAWTRFFTVPVSEAIREQLNRKREMKLETPFDNVLGVCQACDCPLPLKVWMKLEAFLPKMSQESKDALHEACWIRSEQSA